MIAITGGSGPLAHYLVPELIRQGKRLRILYDTAEVPPLSKSIRKVHPEADIRWIAGSVLDIPVLEELMDGCTQVYHLDRTDTFRPADRSAMYRRNIEGTANTVNVALDSGVSKLLFASTLFALGDKCDVSPYDESAFWSDTRSASGFGWSMHLAERQVWRGIAEGLQALIVHTPVLAAGPGLEGSSGEILQYCMHATAYPTGNIHFAGPKDLVTILVELMSSENVNEAFIGYTHRMPYREFIGAVCRQLAKEPPRKAISYLSLKRRAFYGRLNFRNWHNGSKLSKSFARALSDTRVFSNQKLLAAIEHSFQDADAVIEQCIGRYAPEQS